MGFQRIESPEPGMHGPRATRGVVSACLALLLVVAAAAPHRHRNDVADLLTDEPSDSGIFVEATPMARGDTPIAESLRWIDDDPCLACLGSDFATTAAIRAMPDFALSPLRPFVPIHFGAGLSRATSLLASRSPPRS